MIFVYTTCSNKKEAKKISKTLLEEKLVSCVNYWDCESMYPWGGKLTEAKETILLCKTEDNLFGEIRDKIQELHSYELPVIASIPVEINEEYVTWMERQIK